MIFSDNQHGRPFTVARERDFVHKLGFLSATSDDPKEVTAICIEDCTELSSFNRHLSHLS
jgi:hypothetical protein